MATEGFDLEFLGSFLSFTLDFEGFSFLEGFPIFSLKIDFLTLFIHFAEISGPNAKWKSAERGAKKPLTLDLLGGGPSREEAGAWGPVVDCLGGADGGEDECGTSVWT